MDRFNSNEEMEATPLSIAKDIIYSDGTMDEKVKQIESAITEAKKLAISGVRLSLIEKAIDDTFNQVHYSHLHPDITQPIEHNEWRKKWISENINEA